MPYINLPQGKRTLVDIVDFKRLNQYKWCVQRCRRWWYAIRDICTPERHIRIFMHREILGLKRENRKFVDHINGDGLDNRRCNLRTCTNTQNQWNQQVRIGSSRFKGVCWNKRKQKWWASIRKNGPQKFLGCFDDETQAALAYNKAALKYHGDFAHLNII